MKKLKETMSMRKKLFAVVAALMVAVAANAQFEKGKVYVGASLSGLDLSYNGADEGKFAVQASGGYLFADNWMLTGLVDVDHHKGGTDFSIGAGARYHITQNGLYLGASLKYTNVEGSYDDLLPGIQVGYTFFLSRTVTVEPEIYYDHALFNFSDYTTIGFRVGIGVYL